MILRTKSSGEIVFENCEFTRAYLHILRNDLDNLNSRRLTAGLSQLEDDSVKISQSYFGSCHLGISHSEGIVLDFRKKKALVYRFQFAWI